ncbi:head protein [Salmonella enterica]
MATTNNLDSNVSQIVLKKFLPGFMSDLVLAKTVDRQLLAGEINSSTGDSVSFKRPHQFSSLRTATGDISGQTKNNLVSGKATGRVGNYITVAVEYGQLEEAIKLNQLDEILMPVRQRIVTDLETELAKFMMNNGALSLGSPNTPINKWSDVAQTASFLKDLGVNEGENYAVMDPWSAQRLADAQSGLHGSDKLIQTAWEDAQISGNFGGIRALMSNGLASRTQGAFGGTLTVQANPTVTYIAVKDTYQFTVTLAGATASVTGFLKAGDQIKFTNTFWLNQQSKQALYNGSTPISFTATVLQDANSTAGGQVTVTLSGVPIYDAAPQQQYNAVSRQVVAGDAVTVIGTASQTMKPNLFYNKFFCGLGTIPLPKLNSIDSAVATYEGFSIRVHKYADGDANVQKMRFDLLPAYVCFNPHMGGQFFGNP